MIEQLGAMSVQDDSTTRKSIEQRMIDISQRTDVVFKRFGRLSLTSKDVSDYLAKEDKTDLVALYFLYKNFMTELRSVIQISNTTRYQKYMKYYNEANKRQKLIYASLPEIVANDVEKTSLISPSLEKNTNMSLARTIHKRNLYKQLDESQRNTIKAYNHRIEMYQTMLGNPFNMENLSEVDNT